MAGTLVVAVIGLVVAGVWQREAENACAPASASAVHASRPRAAESPAGVAPPPASLEASEVDGDLLSDAEKRTRLAALDASRAAWERRLVDYRSARDALIADASLVPEQREAELESLRARLFDARERLRVRTIDEVELAPPPGSTSEKGAD